MLNLKKGLALVLAAATAFTFAPVANLGNAVQAEAAQGDLLDVKSDTVNLHAGQTRWIKLQSIDKSDWISDKADELRVTVSDTDTVKAGLTNAQTAPANWENTTLTDSVSSTTQTFATMKYLYIKAVKEGNATITLKVLSTSGDQIASETLTVNVASNVANIVFEKDKVEFTKVADKKNDQDYQLKGANTADSLFTQNITVYNTTLPTDADAGSLKLTESSSDKSVAEVTGTNDISVTESQDKVAGLSLQIKAKGVGTATIEVRAHYTVGGVDTDLTIASYDVVVNDGTDTLKVSYDPNRTGSNEDLSLTTTPNTLASGVTDAQVNSTFSAGGNTYAKEISKTGTKIYFDTVNNKTAHLDISDSFGRAYTVKSNVDWVAVDNAGNITVSNPNNSAAYAGTGATTSAFITVYVAPVEVSGKTLAGLTLTIPVTVNMKDTTYLQVNEKNSDGSTGKNLGKTVGGSSNTLATAWAKLPVIKLSLKDKKSANLVFSTNTGAQYISGAAYTDTTTATDKKSSDAVSYANGTLTALKAGKAKVELVCRNSADTQGSATVVFAVEVVTKNANNAITTTADTYNLTKQSPSANIGAKATYATRLKYEIVNKAADDASVVSSSDVTVDANGNIKYNTSNQGSVIVRITGNETTEALAPAAKFVTVNYTSAKSANELKVSNSRLELKPGESGTIGATASTGSVISYKSSDENVATVDANGNVTAKAIGAAFITVDAASTDTVAAGQQIVTVLVSQEGGITATPEKVTGVKVSNKKGAYVSVKWASQGKNINYRVWKKVGNGKWVGKNVAGNKTTLKVKKGAKVQVKVKAYVKDASGKTTWGPKATKAKTFKTDKK